MNTLCLLIALGIVLNSALANTGTNSSGKIENFILERCKRYSLDASSYDNIKEEIAQFTDYMKLSFSHLPDGKRQFCEEDQLVLFKSMKLLAKDMKTCLPQDEKYLPSFLTESLREFLTFLCSRGGKNIDNFFSTLGKSCLQNLKEREAGAEIGNCFKKMFAPLSGVVKKDALCDDLTTAKKCFSESLTKHCPDFTAFRSLNHQFFEAIQKPCNAASTSASALGISSLILIYVTFFTTKIIS